MDKKTIILLSRFRREGGVKIAVKKRCLCWTIAAWAWIAVPLAAQAQGYPSRPIRSMITVAGGADVVARLVAQGLTGALGERTGDEPVPVQERAPRSPHGFHADHQGVRDGGPRRDEPRASGRVGARARRIRKAPSGKTFLRHFGNRHHAPPLRRIDPPPHGHRLGSRALQG